MIYIDYFDAEAFFVKSYNNDRNNMGDICNKLL